MRPLEPELGFKHSFFRICLYVSLSATIFQLAVSIIEFPGAVHLFLSTTLFVVTVVSLIYWKDHSKYSIIVLVNAIVWGIAYILYWIQTNGVFSAPAYVFFVLVIVFIIALPKPHGYFFAVILCLACLALSSIIPTGMNGQGFRIDSNLFYVLATQFLICLLMIVIALYFLKTNFDHERTKNEESNDTLIRLTTELVTKKNELLIKRDKIEELKKNLELLVHERTLQLEEKNEQLSQYAYDNAHILRGALCNILAVINLIKKEQSNNQSKDIVDRINQKAIDLDRLIYQVNNLLK